jgi:hypothetical protein
MGTLLKIIEEMFEKMILLKHPSTKKAINPEWY